MTTALDNVIARWFGKRKAERLELFDEFRRDVIYPLVAEQQIDDDLLDRYFQALDMYSPDRLDWIPNDPAAEKESGIFNPDNRADARLRHILTLERRRQQYISQYKQALQYEAEYPQAEANAKELLEEQAAWNKKFQARYQPVAERYQFLTKQVGSSGVFMRYAFDVFVDPHTRLQIDTLESRMKVLAEELKDSRPEHKQEIKHELSQLEKQLEPLRAKAIQL